MNRLVAFCMRALLPPAGDFPGLEEPRTTEWIRTFRRQAPPLFKLGLVVGALAFVLSPILTIGVPLPAFLLPARLLDRHADRAATSRIYLLKQAVFVVKMGAGLCWGADPRARASLALPAYAADPGTFRPTDPGALEVAR